MDGRTGYLKRCGNKLTLNNRTIHMRGVCFSNHVWSNQPIPIDHHHEKDFENLRNLGGNVIRFYLNYLTFEDDDRPFEYKDEGFRWIDQNVAWAKKNGILLILSLYIAPGGHESENGYAVYWSETLYQNRIAALWRAIALRYRDEPTVAGYDLLHHPVPPENHLWAVLARRIIESIRSVDANHLLIVQGIMRLINRGGEFVQKESMMLMEDENVLYEFHFFEPLEFSHQFAPWFPMFNRETFYSAQPDSKFPRHNSSYLTQRLDYLVNWAERNQVPLYCGEFGLLYRCFEEHRGGTRWLTDVLSHFHLRDIHYTYHSYHEPWFGLYRNEQGLPDSSAANIELVDTLKSWLSLGTG